ncbi:hypothetical protein [Sphingobium sp.]|uniref:hypothetical protein n=1 Tax=Sphingobium sp. TaxID=1912891 RepID=UPI003B3BA3B7
MIRSLLIAGLAASLASSPALAEPDPAIATYVAAFNDTCRRGFPDLDSSPPMPRASAGSAAKFA